jgi:phosphoribosylformylglycinamidine synthase subunit PurL
VGRVVTSVHDCADGGLAVALAEMSFGNGTGFTVTPEAGIPVAAWCFAETASRVVLGVDPARVAEVLDRAAALGVRAVRIGEAGGDRLVAPGAFDVARIDAERAWRDAIPDLVADVHV